MPEHSTDPEAEAPSSILIVEDDEGTHRSLSLVFRGKGYRVDTAVTGQEALDKAGARFYNVVLLDIRLPDMDGVSLLEPLKALHPDMAVIMVTAHASVDTAVQSLNRGASSYIIKPIDLDETLALLREAVDKQRLVQENRRLFQEAERELVVRRRTEQALRESQQRLRTMAARMEQVEEAERKDLARELHDRVGQNLTALSINLNLVLDQLSEASRDRVLTRVNDAMELVEETMFHIRDVMADLRPEVLDDYGLTAGLNWYGERFAARSGLEVEVEGNPLDPRLPHEVESGLFRIVQEALTNVSKHASASRVRVAVLGEGGTLRLIVEDNGAGLDPSPAKREGAPPGWGLITMQERAVAMGGRFSIQGGPGEGTRICIEMKDPRDMGHPKPGASGG